jgi:hypothetical protein
VVAFANAYGLTGTNIRTVGLEALTSVLDAEPVTPEPWRPPTPPTGEAAALAGRWWWMGREYEIHTEGEAITMTGAGHWSRFVRETPDRWRGIDGENEGEILTILRNTDGIITHIDIATFIFSRNPGHLA